jgi:hypothetical protein
LLDTPILELDFENGPSFGDFVKCSSFFNIFSCCFKLNDSRIERCHTFGLFNCCCSVDIVNFTFIDRCRAFELLECVKCCCFIYLFNLLGFV